MSRWERSGWYQSTPKKPPPKHGIRMKKSGTTWWGQRWIEALESVLGGDSRRLARGRTYARAGRTHDLVLKGGDVTAKVTGSRPKPYSITIKVARLSDSDWTKAVAGLAEKAQFTAELLAGQMPKEIGEIFREAGTNLFPAKRADLVTNCSCPDWGDPCKHVAATHYVLGEALDRDPFLLFELRGRTRDQVLESLRAARAGGAPAPIRRGKSKSLAAELDIPRVTLGQRELAGYDRPREALPVLHLSFKAAVTHGALLRQLGTPVAWSSESSPAERLAPLVRSAAETARRLALAEPEPEPDVVDAADSPAPSARENGRRGSRAPQAKKTPPKKKKAATRPGAATAQRRR